MENQSDTKTEIIDRYARGPADLEEIIKGLAESDLDLSESGDSWTIRQHIHHLVDGDDMWKMFIKRAIGNPEAKFDINWYLQVSQDEWARRWLYSGREIQPSLAFFKATRAYICELLRQIPGVLEKRMFVCIPNGTEEEGSVEDIVALMIRHCDGHIADIKRILAVHQGETAVDQP